MEEKKESFSLQDMLDMAAKQAADNPEAVQEAVKETKSHASQLGVIAADIARDEQRVGTIRQNMIAEFEEQADLASLKESFNKMTPEQKAWGKLVGKLLSVNGNADVEDAFTWFQEEYPNFGELTNRDKCLAMFQAAETMDLNDPSIYRGIRKIFVLMNTNL